MENNNFDDEKKTILIVDDEQKIVDLLVHNLTREGYNTIEANDGQTAIDLAISQRPDLILLDVMIPRVDGLTVCKKIKNYYNKMSEDAKIILVNILADNLIYLHDFEVVDKEVVKSISSLLLLCINYNTKTAIKEFDEFSIYEKKVLYSILIDGIASIYVDNEYLEYSDIGTKYKQKIIQELLSFFKYLTKFSKEKVFMIYTKEVKKYRMKEFNWDNIPY